MGHCQYCNKPAGLFKKKHKECESIRTNGFIEIDKIYEDFEKSYTKDIDIEEHNNAYDKVREVCTKSYIDKSTFTSHFSLRIKILIEDILKQGEITEHQESSINRLMAIFTEPSIDDVFSKEIYLHLVKSKTIRNLDENKYPDYTSLKDELPINLLKDELIIWPFWNTFYYDTKTKREYQGSTQGMSIRLAKGLSYRVGAFKGKPVDTENIELIDSGNLIVTNKNLYFIGNKKSFKIKYSDILSFIDYEEGIGIQEDSINKFPKIFGTRDKGFTYKLIRKVASI